MQRIEPINTVIGGGVFGTMKAIEVTGDYLLTEVSILDRHGGKLYIYLCERDRLALMDALAKERPSGL